MGVIAGRARLPVLRVEVQQPRLQFAGKVQDLDLVPELFERRQVAVGCIGCDIVEEGQALANVLGGPVGKVLIEEALVAAIETAILHCELNDALERLQTGPIHEHARVEAVWPTDVGGGGELLALEKLIAILYHQCICIEEDALLELCQTPAVKLCESHA